MARTFCVQTYKIRKNEKIEDFFDEDIKHPVKSHELNELIKDMSYDDLELLILLTRRIKAL